MRKEGLAKSYGLKKAIEGEFEPDDTALIIDDLITKGDSKLEIIEPFRASGLKIKDFVVLIDYETGGSELLRSRGYNLHAFLTMHEVVEAMWGAGKISRDRYRRCLYFLKSDSAAN